MLKQNCLLLFANANGGHENSLYFCLVFLDSMTPIHFSVKSRIPFKLVLQTCEMVCFHDILWPGSIKIQKKGTPEESLKNNKIGNFAGSV